MKYGKDDVQMPRCYHDETKGLRIGCGMMDIG